ncbi:C39 family peptidase [Candidatus Stoquefichus massiliensis]|uniref:C39 family peptidase n=1 Tax=Candidatus Stoquefichus massiliensis TaxID=1470350 RepID=UPI000486A074|nr:C39 family peptidase [Candidatus Stoquefichus massiliensis]
MKRKIIICIIIVIIPFLILILDHYILNEDLHLESSYDASSDWAYITEHQNDYPLSLLKLALHNKETIPFVSRYPQNHKKDFNMNIQDELKTKEIPLLLQWDERWGYKTYGDDMMAINGCGPTCLSMVITYLKQNGQYHPYCIAQFARQKGYYNASGTSWELMREGAKNFGLKVRELALDEDIIKQTLNYGHPIICSVSKGIFTSEGHFIVLREYKDGLIYVNDPNSYEKSQKGYTFKELRYQIKNLWAYSL